MWARPLVLLLLASVSASCAVDEVADDNAPSERDFVAADVSVLMPLPATGTDDLWRASDVGSDSALVPRSAFAAIDTLLQADTSADATYAALRVVGVRFDPCFLHNWGTAVCQPQVRLVLQPFDAQTGTFADAALHAFYNLSDSQFASLERSLRALTAAAPEQADGQLPLGVSASLLAQGMTGTYGRGLRALVGSVASAATLSRLTFMASHGDGAGWSFGGQALRESPTTGFGAPGPLIISPLGEDVIAQYVSPMSVPTSGYGYDVQPQFSNHNGWPTASAEALQALTVSELADVYAWQRKQADPRAVTGDSADCASCHLLEQTRSFVEAAYPELVDSDELASRPGYSGSSSSTLRAFGYWGNEPIVVERTARETAAVLAFLADR